MSRTALGPCLTSLLGLALLVSACGDEGGRAGDGSASQGSIGDGDGVVWVVVDDDGMGGQLAAECNEGNNTDSILIEDCTPAG